MCSTLSSALYVVDLVKFRETAAGDNLRVFYETLSKDPNSLANLDQVTSQPDFSYNHCVWCAHFLVRIPYYFSDLSKLLLCIEFPVSMFSLNLNDFVWLSCLDTKRKLHTHKLSLFCFEWESDKRSPGAREDKNGEKIFWQIHHFKVIHHNIFCNSWHHLHFPRYELHASKKNRPKRSRK